VLVIEIRCRWVTTDSSDCSQGNHGNFRIGTVETERESEDTLVVHATARYKPDDQDSETRPKGASRTGRTGGARETAHETDRWGYTETDLRVGRSPIITAGVAPGGRTARVLRRPIKTGTVMSRELPRMSDHLGVWWWKR
jgi:hypothetical protein